MFDFCHFRPPLKVETVKCPLSTAFYPTTPSFPHLPFSPSEVQPFIILFVLVALKYVLRAYRLDTYFLARNSAEFSELPLTFDHFLVDFIYV